MPRQRQTEIQKARKAFTKNNKMLRKYRSDIYDETWRDYLKHISSPRLFKDRRLAVNSVAKLLVEEGYYSSNISIPAVETMIMRSLYRKAQSEGYEDWYPRTWHSFVVTILGRAWFQHCPQTKMHDKND